MANPYRADFRKPQGYRRLAPPQVIVFALFSFLSGIAATGSGISFPVIAAVSSLVLMSCVAAAPLFRWKVGFPIALACIAACIAGVFYYHFYFAVRAAGTTVPFERSISFTGIVAGEPGHSVKTEYFPLELLPPFYGSVQVFASPGSGFRYGDLLLIRGKVSAPEDERALPATFFPVITRTAAGRGPFIFQRLSDLKYALLDVFPKYLPSEEAAFMGGITLGEKADFSPEFIAALAASGTTHLVALSGYNIAILVLVVFGGLLRAFGRRAAFYGTTLAITLFVAMVGAEPSVVRAAIMGFIILLARELGRPYSLSYALAWTAFLMALFDPGVLFMPGFQLSFISLLGIVYLSPVILAWLGMKQDTQDGPIAFASFRENAALTVSAQLAVAPVALANFGSVSLTSFLANTLILPFMPLTMFMGFLLVACGMVFAPLGALAGVAAHLLLAYEIAVIRFFAALSLPITGSLPWFGIVIYYFVLAWLVRWYKQKRLKEEYGK